MTKKPEVPPIDDDGQLTTAATLLKRFRRQLTEQSGLSQEWQRWVADSLRRGVGEETGNNA